MLLTDVVLKNLTVLVEVGAKAVSSEKGLQESAAMQATAVQLLQKVHDACKQAADAAAAAAVTAPVSPKDPESPKVE